MAATMTTDTLITDLNTNFPLPEVAAGFEGTSFDYAVIRFDDEGRVDRVFHIAGTAYASEDGDILLARRHIADFTDEDDTWGDVHAALDDAVFVASA